MSKVWIIGLSTTQLAYNLGQHLTVALFDRVAAKLTCSAELLLPATSIWKVYINTNLQAMIKDDPKSLRTRLQGSVNRLLNKAAASPS